MDQGHIERTLLRVRLLLTRSAVHRIPTLTATKHRFTGEELQVKFLADFAEISLKY